MDAKRRDQKRSTPGAPPASRGLRKDHNGFAGLDPTKMGLEGPAWLATALPPPAPPLPPCDPTPGMPALAPELPETARSLLEGMKVVCICKGIKKSVFWKVLDAGAHSQDEVNCLTGAGSGGCHGRRCGPRISEMLRDLAR